MEKINTNLASKKMFTNIINYVSIFLIIYLSSGFIRTSMNGTFNIAIIMGIAVMNVLIKSPMIKFKKTEVFIVNIMVLSSLVTLIVNNDSLHNYLIFYAFIFSGFLLAKTLTFDEFIYYFNNTMYFIAIFSLGAYLASYVAPTLLNYFPKVVNINGVTMNNLFFTVTQTSGTLVRNYGLFWEPGAYQIFLNLALFFQLFLIKEFEREKIFIYIVTIITTFSTTGYISMIVLLVTYFFSISKWNFSSVKMSFYIMVFLGLTFLIISNFSDVLLFQIFGKLEIFLTDNLSHNVASYTSSQTRLGATFASLEAFVQNPLFGSGFTKTTELSYLLGANGMLTTTVVNWFGIFGLSLGLILNYPLWKWATLSSNKLMVRIFILLFLVIISVSENLVQNVFYISFLFIAFNNEQKT